jgi:hypothetical protein
MLKAGSAVMKDESSICLTRTSPKLPKMVGIFRPGGRSPFIHLERKQVTDLVARGIAVQVDDGAAHLTPKIPIAKSSNLLKTSHQAEAYELAAIDPHRKYFSGGLTRNEHQPAKFERWHGAKVGHQ